MRLTTCFVVAYVMALLSAGKYFSLPANSALTVQSEATVLGATPVLIATMFKVVLVRCIL